MSSVSEDRSLGVQDGEEVRVQPLNREGHVFILVWSSLFDGYTHSKHLSYRGNKA